MLQEICAAGSYLNRLVGGASSAILLLMPAGRITPKHRLISSCRVYVSSHRATVGQRALVEVLAGVEVSGEMFCSEVEDLDLKAEGRQLHLAVESHAITPQSVCGGQTCEDMQMTIKR